MNIPVALLLPRRKIYCVVLLSSLLFSCTSQKKLVYFQGQVPPLGENAFKLKIYPGDILSIYIFTINSDAFPFLIQPAEKPISDSRSPYERGYVVNSQGEVKIPLIGAIPLKGLGMEEAAALIEAKFKDYM